MFSRRCIVHRLSERKMDKRNYMTTEQLHAETETLSKVFDMVRVLDKQALESKSIGVSGSVPMRDGNCHGFWKNHKPCDDCIVLKAYRQKKQFEKIEIADNCTYQVIARYVEADGAPYVIELIKKLDEIRTPSGGKKTDSSVGEYFRRTYVDVLTGAYNRRYYEESLKNNVCDNVGVAMMDLDDFKIYNDVYGHDAGDAVLRLVTQEMKKSIGKSVTLIRYGGDEYLLVAENVNKPTWEKVLRRLINQISKITIPGFAAIKVSVSVGAVICDDETVEAAVSRADKLMYRAKKRKELLLIDGNEQNERDEARPTVLIVDDSEINREILSAILSNEYNIVEATNGEEAIDSIKELGADLSAVLLDIIMPGIDGFDVLRFMNESHYIEDIPVITISGDDSGSTVRQAYELGASDFINRPFDAKVVYKRVVNTINLYSKQRRLISAVSKEIIENEKTSQILVNILSQIVSFHNGKGCGHVTNMNKLVESLLERLNQLTDKYNLTSRDIFLISTAASLHDIGKLAVDDSIINKPGKLTDEEFEKIKMHTVYGEQMINNMHQYENEPLVRYARQICRSHHERYDGKGYPDGLVGDDIPIAAQVVSVADVYDALTSVRSYKPAYSSEQAVKMILDGECGQFNPLLLQCLTDLFQSDELGAESETNK